MGRSRDSISPEALYARLGAEAALTVVDVRCDNEIRNPALDHPATVVRSADTSRHGIVIYDALYTWCRTLQAETHNWPARAVGA